MGSSTPDGTDSSLEIDLTTAKIATSALQHALSKEKTSIATASAAFTAAIEPLGLTKWIVDDNKLADVATLQKPLDALHTILDAPLGECYAAEMRADTELISNASGGAVLQGLSLGLAPSVAKKQVLQLPASCELVEAHRPPTIAIERFDSVAAANSFKVAVDAFGWAAAADLAHTNVDPKSATGKVAVHVSSAQVSMKTLDMHRASLRLSVQARSDAKDVTDLASAKDFVRDYGSHVRSGVFDFGGIMYEFVELESERATSLATLHNVCDAHASSSLDQLSINCSDFAFGIDVDVQKRAFQESVPAAACDLRTRLDFTGPCAPSFVVFERQLAAANSTWRVIDRPTQLFGVWELLVDAGFPDAATLVRDAWLDLVKHTKAASTLSVQAAIRSAHLDACLADATFGTDAKRQAAASAAAAEMVVLGQLERVDTDPLALVDVVLLALRLDIAFRLSLTSQCLQQKMMLTAMCNLDMTRDLATMGQLHWILSFGAPRDVWTGLAAPVRSALKRAGKLFALQQALQGETALTGEWSAPLVCVDDLPLAMQLVLGVFEATAMPDLDLLTERMGQLLVVNFASPVQHPKRGTLLTTAHTYNFKTNDFDRQLTVKQVQAMITDMSRALNQDRGAHDAQGLETEVLLPAPAGPMPDATPPGHGLSFLLRVAGRPKNDTQLGDVVYHVLKHRLSFQKELYPSTQGHRLLSRRNRAEAPRGPVVLDAFLDFLASLTPAARAEVFRLLLDRRCLVPFIVPSHTQHSDALHAYSTELGLVLTQITNRKASLAHNVDVIRVAVVSEEPTRSSATKDWIKNVFHVESLHCLDRTNGNNVTALPVAAELGWGFVQEDGEFTTVMVLHVIGDYARMRPYIQAIADVLLVDVGSKETVAETLEQGLVVHWGHTSEDDAYAEDDDSVSGLHHVELGCPINSSYSTVAHKILHKVPERRIPRQPIASVRTQRTGAMRLTHSVGLSTTATCAVRDTDFAALRTTTLVLQKLFVKEAELLLKKQRETNVSEQQVLRSRLEVITSQYAPRVRGVMRHGLMQYFLASLQEPSAALREQRLLDLERQVAENSQKVAAVAHEEYLVADANKRERPKDDAVQRAYEVALQKWDDMVTGLEHLWRELSHVYRTNASAYSSLPMLAAQHLVDGFPLELMDGDAGMVNDKWIRAVLRALGNMLPGTGEIAGQGHDPNQSTADEQQDRDFPNLKQHTSAEASPLVPQRAKARIFVLSILGVQSSGKSTLLNCMFGVRLRTSLGRCTRGVTMQLLAVADCTSYDYILLLDTEGIQSPDYVGVEGTVWRDNRMASMAILPADATIILTNGTSMDTIKDVLPIVLSVFANSTLSAESKGQLPSKLYFVFNQIDTTQSIQMVTSVASLMTSLHSSASQIATVLGSDASKFLSDFNANAEDTVSSDVRFLGSTHVPIDPPLNTPLDDYGRRLLCFYDHMHAGTQTEKWRARTIEKCNESFNLVWDCLQGANFEMDFATALDRVRYDQLTKSVTEHIQALAKIYTEALEEVLQKMSEDCAQKVRASSQEYEHELQDHVNVRVQALDAEVATTLAQDIFEKWATTMTDKWADQKRGQTKHSKRLLQAMVHRLFEVDSHVKTFQDMFQCRVSDYVAAADGHTDMDEVHAIFQRVHTEASKCDKSVAPFVWRYVTDAIHNNWIFTPDMLVPLDKSTDGGNAGIINYITTAFSSRKQPQEARTKQIQNKTAHLVLRRLTNIQQYSSEIVLACLVAAKKMFMTMQLKGPELKLGIDVLQETLSNALYQRQARWEKTNSVAAKFAASKTSLLLIAKNMCAGREAADLLVDALRGWLGANLEKAFYEQVISAVVSELKDAPWVESADAMQAALDRPLLHFMRNNDVASVLTALAKSKQHTTSVITNLILEKVQKCYVKVRKSLVKHVAHSIQAAAVVVADAKCNLSKRFVQALQLELQRRLKRRGTSALIASLPSASSDRMNCDEQGSAAFDETAVSTAVINVPRTLLEHLHVVANKLGPSTFKSETMAKNVVHGIQNEAYGASDGILTRCGEPCPRCKCPCTKTIGHASVEGDAGHDTYHQPEGLVGAHYQRSNELVPESCATSVEKKHVMSLRDGSRPYTEFDQVYPGWVVPHITKFLPLREYIFAQAQNELAVKYGQRHCTSIPDAYAHDLDGIEETIEKLLA